MASHEILGEGFAAFELSGSFLWAEYTQASCLELINNSCYEGGFRANDSQMY